MLPLSATPFHSKPLSAFDTEVDPIPVPRAGAAGVVARSVPHQHPLQGDRAVHKDEPPAHRGQRPNVLLLWGIAIGLILATTVIFVGADVLRGVPCRGTGGNRPRIPVNEGGPLCFGGSSSWTMLRDSRLQSIKDAVHMGGMSAKSYIALEAADSTHVRAVWKPQLDIVNGHKSSPFNAVIAFHLDCLLGLQRVPPAAAIAVSTEALEASLSPVALRRYEDRAANWEDWRARGEVYGTAQSFVDGVVHKESYVRDIEQFFQYFGLETLYLRLIGFGDTAKREAAERDMFDFLLANWDRDHNQFFIAGKTPIARSGSVADVTTTQLVFLDYDHLRFSSNAPDVLSGKLPCQFYRESVEKLSELHAQGLSRLLMESLQRERLWETGLAGQRSAPVDFIDIRATRFLDHVHQCVEEHGDAYVFGHT